MRGCAERDDGERAQAVSFVGEGRAGFEHEVREMFVVGADIGGIAHDEVELFLLADRLPPGAAAKRHLGLEFLRVAFGRKQRLLRDVGRHDFGILHFQGERDGEASAPRAEIEHARRLAKEFERRVDEHFRVGPGNQNGGIHLEETPVKILLSRNVGTGVPLLRMTT